MRLQRNKRQFPFKIVRESKDYKKTAQLYELSRNLLPIADLIKLSNIVRNKAKKAVNSKTVGYCKELNDELRALRTKAAVDCGAIKQKAYSPEETYVPMKFKFRWNGNIVYET